MIDQMCLVALRNDMGGAAALKFRSTHKTLGFVACDCGGRQEAPPGKFLAGTVCLGFTVRVPEIGPIDQPVTGDGARTKQHLDLLLPFLVTSTWLPRNNGKKQELR